MRRTSSKGRNGCGWCRIPTAAGARPAGRTDDPNTRGVGPSTPSQTAWAVMGLLAADDTRSDSVARGVAYLFRTQQKSGEWDEPTARARVSRECFI